MLASWRAYQDRGGAWAWERWSDNYVNNQGHAARGTAFENAYFEARRFADGEWRTNYSVKGDLDLPFDRNYDIVQLEPRPVAYELKSGNSVDAAQLAKDAKLTRSGVQVNYVFGREPSAATIARLRAARVNWEVFYSVPEVAVARAGR